MSRFAANQHLPGMTIDTPATVIAGFTAEENQAYIWSLVLSAAGIEHWLMKDNSGWLIKVTPERADLARLEITAYEKENLNWPAPDNAEPGAKDYLARPAPPTVLMMGGLVIFYSITGPWGSANPWFKLGAVNTEKVLTDGEWWRLVTGLLLHSDPVHLLSNVIIGGFLVHFLCRALGSGLGWLLILLAGTAGNYLNIVLRAATHSSVGFSTAVFGSIGILAGYQSLSKRRMAIKEILLPLAGGAGLLAFIGSAGENTDLGAHFFGLLAGIILGIAIAAAPGRRRLTSQAFVQSLLFLLCLSIVVFSCLRAWY